ncbi:MAG: SpoIIE family protein phosphatase, partial [Lachnospiraceae bacterium]|nr:SpoIIE family protein phosphatase [Lachnospiraceae bacterium]
MDISFSIGQAITLFFIAIGIGVLGLSFFQVTAGTFLRKEIRRYFQILFAFIILYLLMHLTREMMNGIPGQGIRIAIYAVTFVEFMASGFTMLLISLLTLFLANPEGRLKLIGRVVIGLLILHGVLLLVSQFTGLLYKFDENNVYSRGPMYIISNLAPVLMMALDAVLLIRYRQKYPKSVWFALWLYIVLPIVAAVLQLVFPGIQFIIVATVIATLFMFAVILQRQIIAYDAQRSENSRIETELTMATRIQTQMLPNIFPAFPDREEFDVYASMDPAKEVGGDFYDFFLIDDDHVGLVIADVSGKGVPAALFMMGAKILFQNGLLAGKSPKETLESVNEQICKSNHEDMFVTAWMGILELSTGRLTAANAGHEYPAVRMPDGRFELLKDKHGFVIGGVSGSTYTEYELRMAPG